MLCDLYQQMICILNTWCIKCCETNSNYLNLHGGKSKTYERTTDSKHRQARSTITLAQKLEILRRLDKNEHGVNLALEFKVSRQQISDIKIEEYAHDKESETALERKQMKTAKNDEHDKAVYI
eukprot:TRINITY_DN3176_c0_g1_i2.p4 TRINITY_DN3176_c0_g1~~TRINITY_DN3176_c0_g1_i2.p4  ORF type:complete len:123 (-),score=5.63 TRINITY_DN3176_c0_g1_i2:1255-1623(-)